MRTTVSVRLERNDAGRLRVPGTTVRIEALVDAIEQLRMRRCLQLFEDLCVFTQSVRGGIDVDVTVEPQAPAGTVGRRHTGGDPQSRAPGVER